MGVKSVCLSVCLSAPSSTFPAAQSLTLTTAFESLGLGYVPPTCPHGQPERARVELGLLSPLFCQVRRYSAQLRSDIWGMTAGYFAVQIFVLTQRTN